MQMFLDDPVFTVDDQPHTWADVVHAATLRGDWDALESLVREELACLAHAAAAGDAVDRDAVDEAARRFRYDRDLITAAETERWLEQWGLTPAGWMAWVRRSVARSLYTSELAALVSRHPVAQAAIDQVVLVDAVCHGQLARFARTLAERAAAAAALAAAPDDTAVDGAATDPGTGERDAAPVDSGRRAIPGLRSDPGRLATLRELDRAHARFLERVRSTAALGAIVSAHRLDWIRLTCRVLEFSDEPAALEAALCVRDDGEPVERVADLAHAPLRQVRFHLDEVDGALRHRMFSAGPGELVGPVAENGGFRLYEIVGKEVPEENDALVRARATDVALRRAVAVELERRVRWLSPSYATA
ncbi:MAG TPA: hypothetical protein VMM18_10740 [Gemmatimonadaceae bacterium]|nr:hypothetical protein [Gemmatimonadaceae bacterium]